METLVSSARRSLERQDSSLFHDASEHGLGWALLNQILHIIIAIYTLYGIFQLKIGRPPLARLVRWASQAVIVHSWYLSIKLGLLSASFYWFNLRLEKKSIKLADLNCTFANYRALASTNRTGATAHQGREQDESELAALLLESIPVPDLGEFLDSYGGPFRVLGNKATLLYGLFAIALYIMLALFPAELIFGLKIDFNFIRFVLSDPNCMTGLYARRDQHLTRLNSWSRHQADSLLTQGAMLTLNQRNLRSSFMDRWTRLFRRAPNDAPLSAGEEAQLRADEGSEEALTLNGASGIDLGRPHSVTQLRTRLAVNHHDRPSYQVCVANKNLQKFKPFVRSHVWFKASMVIYPIFINYYFSSLLLIMGLIVYYVQVSLWETLEDCRLKEQFPSGNQKQLDANWSWWDRLNYYENVYTVFALSVASSFYCSYYFGTIIELWMWISELEQQLRLSAHVVELTHIFRNRNQLNDMQMRVHQEEELRLLEEDTIGLYVNEFGGLNVLFPRWRDYIRTHLTRRKRAEEFNRFKGPGGKYRLEEQIAIRLLTKKQTLLRATYVNMCLFFDELHEVRVMTTIILRRTTQIAAGFAFMASITRSQFKLSADGWQVNSLLIGVFVVFNSYLACAAFISGCVNKMLRRIHSLIAACLKTGAEDVDLFEFWVRHVNSFGEDMDPLAFQIYGYKLTWGTIVKLDSIILTLYFLTTEL